VQWRVSRHESSLGSWIGLVFTAVVVTISLYYGSMRYEVLVNHGDSSVQAFYRKDFHSDDHKVTLESVQNGSGAHNFKMMFSI